MFLGHRRAAVPRRGYRGCTSSAWLASFLGAHSWLLSHFPEQAQADVWSDGPDVSIGGIFAPMGKAKAVDGGYVLDGRWPWSSGIIHDEWTILGAFIEGQTPPKLHMFLIAPGDFTWEDTWHNVGLSASGSHDTVVENAFVPTHRVMPFEWARDGVGPGVESLGSSLYQVPLAPGFSYNAAYVALGAARGAYEYLREWTKSRASSVTGAGVAEHPSTQAELTETAVELDSAQLLLERTGRRILNPAALDLKTRVECRRDNVYSVKVILSALDRMQRMAGARGMYVSNPIQRAWRDAHAIATHVVFNFQTVGEFYGASNSAWSRPHVTPTSEPTTYTVHPMREGTECPPPSHIREGCDTHRPGAHLLAVPQCRRRRRIDVDVRRRCHVLTGVRDCGTRNRRDQGSGDRHGRSATEREVDCHVGPTGR